MNLQGSQAEYRGKVVVTGSEPATSVRLVGSERNLELTGKLKGELRRLAGASVIVRGLLEGGRPTERLDVREYEITDIDGEVPAVGVLRSRGGRLWLDGSDTVELAGAPETLVAEGGAKVWVVGRRSDNTLVVQSYGLIKEARRSAPPPGDSADT